MTDSDTILMIDFDEVRTYKGLKFCHLNVRSIVNKLDQFKIHFESSSFDVITISETWLTEDIDSCLLNMSDYQLLRADRETLRVNGVKKGGGLMIYVRNDLNFTLVHGANTNISCPDVEVQRLELCSSVQKNILLFNVYRPPNGSVSNCLDRVESIIDNEEDLHFKELVLLGDFNLNFSTKSSPDTKKLVQWQNRRGLNQLIKTYTRSSKRSATIIDLIFTNMENCKYSGVLNLHISDHQPVYFIKKKVRESRRKVVFKGRTYVNYSKETLSDCLTNAIKLEFRDEVDPNKCWDLMATFLYKFLDEHCPIRTFRTTDNTPPWVTHDLIVLAKDRDRAWELAKLSNNDDDWVIARHFRNMANNSVKAAKANYVKNELENNRADPKKFWMNIKNVLPDSSGGNINIVDGITKNILPKVEQAQEINDFFATIGKKLDSKFRKQVEIDETVYDGDVLEVDPISQVEVLDLVKHISMYKSSGMDNVSSRVLKDFLILASREITLLYNRVIATGVFPDKWKVATVTPIPKVQIAEHPTDLRPISLLPIPGKLLEKYITKQITYFLEGKNYFVENQFGFRKNKSTTGALTTILDDIISQLNNAEYSLVAYLDFQTL